jgi:hypothetical protein
LSGLSTKNRATWVADETRGDRVDFKSIMLVLPTETEELCEDEGADVLLSYLSIPPGPPKFAATCEAELKKGESMGISRGTKTGGEFSGNEKPKESLRRKDS